MGRGAPRLARATALLGAAAALALATPAHAQQQPPQDSAQVHLVRPGDTLWDLARRYLGDPFQWPEIFRINRERVENPNRIFPAERLLIPGAARRATAPVRTAAAPVDAPAERTVFFREPVEDPRSADFRAAARAVVPVVERGEFLAAGLLAEERELGPVGRLTELAAATVVPVEMPASVRLYDRVFMVLSEAGRVRVGDRLHLVRPGRSIKGYGRVYEPTGLAVVEAVEGGTATLLVDALFDAVAVGDLAVPVPEYSVPAGARPRPFTGSGGRIVAFEDPQPVHSTEDIAFLSLGRADGLSVGDEFQAVMPAERRGWGTRPELVVARLQVVRVAERTAAARVIELEQPALEPGLTVRQVARMP